MKSKKKKITAGLCLIGLLICTLFPAAGVKASPLEESIRSKQNQISQARAEKKKLQSGLSDVKKMVKELEKSKNNLENYVVELDGKLTSIENKITEYTGLISEKEKEIENTKQELQTAKEVEAAQYAAMKKRIKFLYEKRETGYMELLLSSKSFGDLLNKAEYIEKLSAYDREQLIEFQQNVELIAACQQALEEEEEVLKTAKASVEKEQKSMEALISEKEKEIVAFQSDIGSKEAAIKDYEADIAAQNATISALEKAVEEEKKKMAEQNRPKQTYDGGMFQFPCPSYKRVSSEYGNRMHPTLGIKKFHNGVDLAAPGGSPILAAYDGTVVGAGYNSSMGNYVMINHGDGLYTVYMHASALYVSNGQKVSKGAKIAAVGSTGRSTGNHLHFSVRLNGSYVNPWNYLK